MRQRRPSITWSYHVKVSKRLRRGPKRPNERSESIRRKTDNRWNCLKDTAALGGSSGGENAGLGEYSELYSLNLSGLSDRECESFSEDVFIFSPWCVL